MVCICLVSSGLSRGQVALGSLRDTDQSDPGSLDDIHIGWKPPSGNMVSISSLPSGTDKYLILACAGDVVRIAPNELAFISPEAIKSKLPQANLLQHVGTGTDHVANEKAIYGSAKQNREVFTKTRFQEFGLKHPGITAERDPDVHRQMAKMLAPALSVQSIRGQEPVVHEHVDLLVRQIVKEMKENSSLELKHVGHLDSFSADNLDMLRQHILMTSQ